MKVDVIYGEPENLQAALREWLGQHARARIQAATQSSAQDGSGKILVTVVLWYQE